MDEFKAIVILDTAQRLRANGHEKEASDLEWDLTALFLTDCFCDTNDQVQDEEHGDDEW